MKKFDFSKEFGNIDTEIYQRSRGRMEREEKSLDAIILE